MADLYFTEDHEYLSVDGDMAKVGITAYAVEQLGDIIFAELPDVGKTLAKGDDVAVVESVKTAADVKAPASGEVTRANTELEDAPQWVNEEPMGKAWFFEMRLSNADELSSLMDKNAYDAFVKGL